MGITTHRKVIVLNLEGLPFKVFYCKDAGCMNLLAKTTYFTGSLPIKVEFFDWKVTDNLTGNIV